MNGVERSNDGVVLKRCPFCGGKAKIMHNPREDRISPYYVYCTDCLASTETNWDKEEAIKAWNKRS